MPSGRSTPPTESLLSPAAVRLFGRIFDGVTLTAPTSGSDDAAAHGYTSHRLATLLRTSASARGKAAGQPAGRLARIYAFIYQGHYYRLAVPTAFLVAGEGETVVTNGSGSDLGAIGQDVRDERSVELTIGG